MLGKDIPSTRPTPNRADEPDVKYEVPEAAVEIPQATDTLLDVSVGL